MNTICPNCKTELYSQLFDARGARLFCPKCNYEEFLPVKFELHKSGELE